jgi:hypothetical protein
MECSILSPNSYEKHFQLMDAKSAMERIPLHSWKMEFSIQYHMTINSQLNDQNSIKYYIKANNINACHLLIPGDNL